MPRRTKLEDSIHEALNPASMRPGRNAPENRGERRRKIALLDASMRPGRNAPENLASTCRTSFDPGALQ